MNTQNLKNLFHSQLEACSEEYHRALVEKFGDQIDSQELLETLNRVRGTQNLDLTKKVKTTKNPKEPKPAKKPKEPKDPSALCQARTWGDGSGDHQCTFGSGSNGLCTKHAKAEQECCVPCTTTDNGNKRVGLYMGRINQWQDGVEGILPYKDELGLLRIEWTSDHMKSIIHAALEDGTCQRPDTGIASKKGRKPTSKKSAAAAELAAIVPTQLETSSEPAAEPETSSEQAADPEIGIASKWKDLCKPTNTITKTITTSTSTTTTSTSPNTITTTTIITTTETRSPTPIALPIALPVSVSWACSKCTYIHEGDFVSKTTCEMCETPRLKQAQKHVKKETSSKKPKNNHRGPAIDKLSDGTKDPSAYVAQIEAGFSKTRITKVSSKKLFYKYKKQAPPHKPPNPTIFVPVPPSNEQLLKNIRIKLALNPKNKGTKSWYRYEAYQHATTLYEYLYAGGGGGNGDYKYDFAEGNLSIHPDDEWWSQPIPDPIFD